MAIGEDAYDQGYLDGLDGYDEDANPYGADSEDWEHWLDGWDAAQEDLK